jgi:hypothetical protein
MSYKQLSALSCAVVLTAIRYLFLWRQARVRVYMAGFAEGLNVVCEIVRFCRLLQQVSQINFAVLYFHYKPRIFIQQFFAKAGSTFNKRPNS